MLRRIVFWILILNLPIGLIATHDLTASVVKGPISVLAAGTADLILALDLPAVEAVSGVKGATRYTIVTAPGLEAHTTPGAPLLPLAATLISVPPGATVRAEILSDNTRFVPLDAPVEPAPQVQIDVSPKAPLPAIGGANYAPDPAIYQAAAVWPADVVVVETPTTWREYQLARVYLHPVQYDPARNRLILHTSLRVMLHFDDADRTRAATGAVNPSDPLATVLDGEIAAPPQSRERTGVRVDSAPTAAAPALAEYKPWYRILVQEVGLTDLTCDLLAAAGIDLTAFNLNRAAIFADGQDGVSIPREVRDANDDGRCEESDRITFFAEASARADVPHAVYWMAVDTDSAIPVAQQPSLEGGQVITAVAQAETLEENRRYFSYVPMAPATDHWYWDVLSPFTGASRIYTFTLTGLVQGTAEAKLSVRMAGYDGAHSTQITLNGQALADEQWAGRRHHEISVPVTSSLLIDGSNLVEVAAVEEGIDIQYTDALTLTADRALHAQNDLLVFTHAEEGLWTYVVDGFSAPDIRAYDVTDPRAVRRITAVATTTPCPCTLTFGAVITGSRSFLLRADTFVRPPLAITQDRPSALRAPDNGADYLAIGPAEFLPVLEPLIEHRAAQGLRVRLIDLQDIYDEFAGGMATAQAIHDFLAYASADWISPAPAYVLLAGDGTYDPHGYVTSPAAAMLPAYLQFVDPLLGETASDNRLAVFGPEPLPSLAIGRLPARSAAELAVMVDKILGYERAPSEGNWRGRLAFVADNAFGPDGMPDPAGNFWTLSEAIAGDPALVHPDFVLERFYYNPCDPAQTADCASPARSFADNDALTAGLVAAWNAGLLLVNYVGHGAPASWAGAPTLFSATEATSLTNGDRLPVTLEMTCYTGAFHFPQRETVAEALIRAPRGGAVAALASSGVGVVSAHDLLDRGFLQALMSTNAPTLGQAMLAAKLHVWVQGGGAYPEALDTFHLFGDPALRLALPATTATVFLPVVKGER